MFSRIDIGSVDILAAVPLRLERLHIQNAAHGSPISRSLLGSIVGGVVQADHGSGCCQAKVGHSRSCVNASTDSEDSSQRDLERRYSPSKDVFTTGYTNAPLMSTTAIMNPVPQFATAKDSLPSGPPPPYRASAVPQSLSGLMSPPTSQSTDSRRTSDDTKEQNRLPSIAEAIGPQNAEPRSTAYSAAPAHGAYVQPYASSTTPGSQRFSQDPSVYSLHHESPQPRRSPPAPSVHSAANKYGLGSEPAGYSDGVRPPPLRMSASMQSPSHTSPYVRDLPPRQEVEPRYGAERMEHPSAYSATRDSYRGYPSAPPPAAAYHPIDRSYNRPQDRIDDYGPPKRLGPPNNYNGPYETTLKRNLDIWEVETNLEAVRTVNHVIIQQLIAYRFMLRQRRCRVCLWML